MEKLRKHFELGNKIKNNIFWVFFCVLFILHVYLNYTKNDFYFVPLILALVSVVFWLAFKKEGNPEVFLAILTIILTLVIHYTDLQSDHLKKIKSLAVVNGINHGYARALSADNDVSELPFFETNFYRDNWDFIVAQNNADCFFLYVGNVLGMEISNKLNSNISYLQLTEDELEKKKTRIQEVSRSVVKDFNDIDSGCK